MDIQRRSLAWFGGKWPRANSRGATPFLQLILQHEKFHPFLRGALFQGLFVQQFTKTTDSENYRTFIAVFFKTQFNGKLLFLLNERFLQLFPTSGKFTIQLAQLNEVLFTDLFNLLCLLVGLVSYEFDGSAVLVVAAL